MSRLFLNLIERGENAEVASAVEAEPALASCRDAQGISALLLSIYQGQTLIRDFLLSRLEALDLFEASAAGDCARIGALLEEDATRVFTASADGWSPLHLAAAFGGPQATALLLEHGAHVHAIARNAMRCQPLNAAIGMSGDRETVRILLEQGADANFAEAGGYAPLHQAAARGDAEMVRMLLAAGADRGRLCDRDKTPAEYARERGHAETAALLEA